MLALPGFLILEPVRYMLGSSTNTCFPANVRLPPLVPVFGACALLYVLYDMAMFSLVFNRDRCWPSTRKHFSRPVFACDRFDLVLVLRAETSTLFDRLKARYYTFLQGYVKTKTSANLNSSP